MNNLRKIKRIDAMKHRIKIAKEDSFLLDNQRNLQEERHRGNIENNITEEMQKWKQNKIETELSGDKTSYGSMFNIRAVKKIVISSFEFYTESTSNLNYLIYTVNGTRSYEEVQTDLTQWILIANGTTTGVGSNGFTPVNAVIPQVIDQGDIKGFYLTLTSPELKYSTTLEYKVGDVYQTNDDIYLVTGTGVSDYPLSDRFVTNRLFRGAVEYYIYGEYKETLTPTLTPSINDGDKTSAIPSSNAPTASPTNPLFDIQYINTNQTITLSNIQQTMDNSGIQLFKDTTKTLVQSSFDSSEAIISPPINITYVQINNQYMLKDDVISALYVEIFIQGRYYAHDIIIDYSDTQSLNSVENFHNLVTSALGNSSKDFKFALKSSGVEYFNSILDVVISNSANNKEQNSNSTSSNQDDTPSESTENDNFFTTTAGYITLSVLGILALVLILSIFKYFCCKPRKVSKHTLHQQQQQDYANSSDNLSAYKGTGGSADNASIANSRMSTRRLSKDLAERYTSISCSATNVKRTVTRRLSETLAERYAGAPGMDMNEESSEASNSNTNDVPKMLPRMPPTASGNSYNVRQLSAILGKSIRQTRSDTSEQNNNQNEESDDEDSVTKKNRFAKVLKLEKRLSGYLAAKYANLSKGSMNSSSSGLNNQSLTNLQKSSIPTTIREREPLAPPTVRRLSEDLADRYTNFLSNDDDDNSLDEYQYDNHNHHHNHASSTAPNTAPVPVDVSHEEYKY